MSAFQAIDAAERAVLHYLEANRRPVRINALVESVVEGDEGLDPDQLKVATLNLISAGKARVDFRWEIVASDDSGDVTSK